MANVFRQLEGILSGNGEAVPPISTLRSDQQRQARVRERIPMKDVVIALVFLAMIVGPGFFAIDVFGEKKHF
jgi:hypothetical protein